MEQIKIAVEIEEEVQQDDRFGIEDKIADALKELGFTVISVRVYF